MAADERALREAIVAWALERATKGLNYQAAKILASVEAETSRPYSGRSFGKWLVANRVWLHDTLRANGVRLRYWHSGTRNFYRFEVAG